MGHEKGGNSEWNHKERAKTGILDSVNALAQAVSRMSYYSLRLKYR